MPVVQVVREIRVEGVDEHGEDARRNGLHEEERRCCQCAHGRGALRVHQMHEGRITIDLSCTHDEVRKDHPEGTLIRHLHTSWRAVRFDGKHIRLATCNLQHDPSHGGERGEEHADCELHVETHVTSKLPLQGGVDHVHCEWSDDQDANTVRDVEERARELHVERAGVHLASLRLVPKLQRVVDGAESNVASEESWQQTKERLHIFDSHGASSVCSFVL
mmetsp:Transcript_57711/g.153840  ORF Transcript_57711/g.153840 Transcript_57711/m.153840 type:complete len:219 (-) Transcript_57711:1067-1723(-)